MSALGPFETEREARAAARAIIPACDGASILSAAQNRQMLSRVCEAAGIEMGRYDDRIIEWLAGWEDSTCAVVAGLIARASRAHEDSRRLGEIRALLTRFDWEHDDRQYALEAIERIAGDDQPRDVVTFTAGQASTAARALADAEAYRRKRAADRCADCETTAAAGCSDHLDDLDQADAYRDLAAQLGGAP